MSHGREGTYLINSQESDVICAMRPIQIPLRRNNVPLIVMLVQKKLLRCESPVCYSAPTSIGHEPRLQKYM